MFHMQKGRFLLFVNVLSPDSSGVINLAKTGLDLRDNFYAFLFRFHLNGNPFK